MGRGTEGNKRRVGDEEGAENKGSIRRSAVTVSSRFGELEGIQEPMLQLA
jgi:hypothetical protein